MSVKCKSCGNELPVQVKFCIQCGATVTPAQSFASGGSGLAATEDLSGATQPMAAQEKDYSTNVYVLPPGATEVLSAATTSTGKTTQELTPVTEAVAANLPKTSVVAQPQKGTLPQAAKPVAAAKSGGRLPMAIAAVVLLAVVGAAGIYMFRRQTTEVPANEVTANAEPSPDPQSLAVSISTTPSPSSSASPSSTTALRAEATPSNSNVTGQKAGNEEELKKNSLNEKENAEKKVVEIRQEPEPERKVVATPLPKEPAVKEQPAVSAAELLQRGLNAQSGGRHQEALNEFQKVLKQEPSNVNVYYLIGASYHALGQLDQALAAYRKCTSGAYARVSAEHVKKLEKKVGKSKY
jgi:hypothetical protein